MQDHLTGVLRPGLPERAYEDGELLLRQGEQGTFMMYILEGQVEVTVRLQIPRDGSNNARYSLFFVSKEKIQEVSVFCLLRRDIRYHFSPLSFARLKSLSAFTAVSMAAAVPGTITLLGKLGILMCTIVYRQCKCLADYQGLNM